LPQLRDFIGTAELFLKQQSRREPFAIVGLRGLLPLISNVIPQLWFSIDRHRSWG